MRLFNILAVTEEVNVIFLLLLILWLVFSGKITLEIIIFGVLAASLVWIFAARFLGWGIRREIAFYRLLPRMASYGILLILEIIKSCLAVLPYAWGIKKPDGMIVEFDSGLCGDTANAVLANSITMTPGTITIAAVDGHFTVHCLSPQFADGIESTSFARRLRKMESVLERRDGE